MIKKAEDTRERKTEHAGQLLMTKEQLHIKGSDNLLLMKWLVVRDLWLVLVMAFKLYLDFWMMILMGFKME